MLKPAVSRRTENLLALLAGAALGTTINALVSTSWLPEFGAAAGCLFGVGAGVTANRFLRVRPHAPIVPYLVGLMILLSAVCILLAWLAGNARHEWSLAGLALGFAAAAHIQRPVMAARRRAHTLPPH